MGWGRIPECDICASNILETVVRGRKKKSLTFSPRGISQHAPDLGIPKIFTNLANHSLPHEDNEDTCTPAPGPSSVTFGGIWILSSSFVGTSSFFSPQLNENEVKCSPLTSLNCQHNMIISIPVTQLRTSLPLLRCMPM